MVFARIAAAAVAAVSLVAHAAPPQVAGCDVYPADNYWNTRIDNLRVHPQSAAWVATIGATLATHPDFGSTFGIPFTTVPASQPAVTVTFDVPDESDAGPYPVPANAPIEGGPASSGDRHVIVLERDNCILFEMGNAYPQPGGGWHAFSGAAWDLKTNRNRPDTWTSSDAAGLPILAGLLRYDEFAAGDIRHAIRFTAPQTQKSHLWPATHDASSLTGAQYPPMGARFRLKASFDESTFAPQIRNVLRAMKRYGIVLADNGSPWYFTGEQNASWNDVLLDQLKLLHGSDFEAVDASPLQVAPGSAQSFAPPPKIAFREVVRGFSEPTAMAVPPDGSGRLFVLEKAGFVRIVKNGVLQPTPFLDIHALTIDQSEEGLLGLAFHPDFAGNNRFFIYYTDLSGDVRIAGGTASVNPDVANPALADVITIPHRLAPNHNGGALVFGPDGYLYAGVGDGGGGGDPQNNAQNLGVLLGKVLRLDVAPASGYNVPPDNPFVGVGGARPEIWAYGLRNPWRITFDRLTGDLYIGDVGQNLIEEVDYVPAIAPGGSNFGWRQFEGNACYDPPTGCSVPNYRPPIFDYPHNDGTGGYSVTGGYVYRGLRYPALQGYYLFADFGTVRVWAATHVGDAWTRFVVNEQPTPIAQISSFGEDNDGELYLLSYADGVLYAIESVARDADTPPPMVVEAPRKVDFDGDGKQDLAWRHGSGLHGLWRMSGLDIAGAAAVSGPPGATLRLAAALGGAAQPAYLVWRHADGAYSISATSGAGLASTTQVLPAGTGWEIVGTGDFDGDGKADLLLRYVDDRYGVWLMDGATIRTPALIGTLGPGWEVTMVGRFTGSPRTDLLWRHSRGLVIVTAMAPGGTQASPPINLQHSYTGWVPMQVGDFDANGSTDIVWRHPDGRVRITPMQGPIPLAPTTILSARTTAQLALVADLDGDGKSDLVWTDAAGNYGGWLMNGTAPTAFASFGALAHSGWRIAGTADLDGDGKADLLWRHSSGAYGGWLMNGLSPSDVRQWLSGGTRWEAVP